MWTKESPSPRVLLPAVIILIIIITMLSYKWRFHGTTYDVSEACNSDIKALVEHTPLSTESSSVRA